MSSLTYRPEIDGLRAVAVIPVILFHMGLYWLPGGFIGVDVFFVISGFLITSIIKKELDQDSFSFRDFWARRVRRILPAMIFVTAVTLTVTYLFVFQPDQQAIGKQGLAALLSVANIYFWQSSGDYWGKEAEESPFLHAWSLSVEEQFYLFFPVAMWLIFRFRSQCLQGCILTVTLGSFALFVWGLQGHRDATFYLLPARVWELGTGCLLAVSLSHQPPRTSNFGIFTIAGLGMVVASYLFVDKLSVGVSLAVVGTALIIAFGQTGLCKKLLSQRFVVHIGKISYSLYLWHWPVLVIAKPLWLDWPGISDRVILILVTYILAFGTYQLVEKPTRKRKGVVPRILVSLVLVASAALVMAWKMPRYYDTSGYDNPRWVEYNCRPNWKPETSAVFINTIIKNPKYRADALSSGEGVRIGNEKTPPEIIVFGDSHGLMWGDAIADVARELKISMAFFVIGHATSPFFEIPPKLKSKTNILTAREKLDFDWARLRAVSRENIKLVIIAARWELYSEKETKPLLDLLDELDIQVLLVGDPPRLRKVGEMNVMQYLAWKRLLPKRPPNDQQIFLPCHALGGDDGAWNIDRVLAGKYDNVRMLPTYDLYATGGEAIVTHGRVPLYLDDDHLTSQGANLALPRMREKITEIIGER